MSDGQLALNTNLVSPGLFLKDSNGDLVKVGPVHVGTTAPNVSPGVGGQAGNSKGELWLDTSGSDYTLKTWDGSAWREIVVTSAMIKDGTIVNADVNASAAIAHTKLANITAGSVLLGNASNVPTATALSGDVTVSNAGVTAIGSGVIVNADVNASAAIAGTKISPDFGSQNVLTTGDLQGASVNGGALAGMRNRIINGGMDIAQRGTSFAAIAHLAYSIDRWQWGQAGAMVCTVSQSTDVPNNTFQSSYKVDVTTVDSSIAAGDFAIVSQYIEGYNARDLIGTTFTLSFWVKSPKTGTHCVAFRNSVNDRAFVKEYTIVAANTWEYKTLTVSGGLITAGTWNWTNGLGLAVVFALACGSTFHTTADAWQTGNFIATANQVNVMDNTANDFFITGVQLEPGAVATPFERRPIGTELSLCQRYYEHVYAVFSNTQIYWPWTYKVTKRALPTFTVFSGASNGANLNAGTVHGTYQESTATAVAAAVIAASAEL
jgi:hypothetical protein